jgi:hypothetical protein
VFAASPETIRREPQECNVRRSVGNLQDLAACTLWNPVVFLLKVVVSKPLYFGNLERYEFALPAIHSEQIRHHLPSYGKCGSIGIPLLLFLFIDQSQVVILLRRQFCGFYQNPLNMLVALFGKRVRITLLAELFSSPQSSQ